MGVGEVVDAVRVGKRVFSPIGRSRSISDRASSVSFTCQLIILCSHGCQNSELTETSRMDRGKARDEPFEFGTISETVFRPLAGRTVNL